MYSTQVFHGESGTLFTLKPFKNWYFRLDRAKQIQKIGPEKKVKSDWLSHRDFTNSFMTYMYFNLVIYLTNTCYLKGLNANGPDQSKAWMLFFGPDSFPGFNYNIDYNRLL